MNELVEKFARQASDIAQQYESGVVNFADLNGLGEGFAASFSESVAELSDARRAESCSTLESVLQTAIRSDEGSEPEREALNELLLSLSRTPIS